MTAYERTPEREQDSDDAQTGRQPFTARVDDAQIQAGDGVVDFGTPRRERADGARVTCEATGADEIVPEPTVTVSLTAPTADGDGGISAAACLPAPAARRLADLAETCCSDDEIRSEPETLVDGVAAVARLSSHRSDVTLVEDAAAQVGVLYSDSDDEPTLVINTSGAAPEIDAGARLAFVELRAVAESLRTKAEVVEQGGGR